VIWPCASPQEAYLDTILRRIAEFELALKSLMLQHLLLLKLHVLLVHLAVRSERINTVTFDSGIISPHPFIATDLEIH
jgi:hypothetical protein